MGSGNCNRPYRIFVLMRLIVIVFAWSGVAAAQETQLPNVLLIISDDHHWRDYSFMGHPQIRTPHLDELAKQSAVFTRGYVPTSLCSPSLATIITGLYPHQHGITGNDPAVPADRLQGNPRTDPAYLRLCEKMIAKLESVSTLPRKLSTQGYLSFQTGKWWGGSYARGGFTHGMTHGIPARGGRHGDEGLKIGRQGLQPIFDFLETAGDQPFFVWYAPFLPHTPHNPPAHFLSRYENAGLPAAQARYFAMCEWFDQTCGELLSHLQEQDLSRNTLVIYVADNGWIQRTPQTPAPADWRRSFAPRSKQSPYEGGVRTPIMIRWPGHVEPGMRKSLASSIDIVPTVLAATGINVDASLPGVNLLAVGQEQGVAERTIFGEIFAHDIADIDNPQKSLIYTWCTDDRWKLIKTYPHAQKGRYASIHPQTHRSLELYDLIADPDELNDLSSTRPQMADELSRRIGDWARATGLQRAADH